MQNNKPLDKGRVVFIAEKYQSNEMNPHNNQPVTKNRYATVGRATLWPSNNQSTMPNIEFELDCVPVSASHPGSLKLFVFWDSENNIAQQQAPGNYQQAQAVYQQQQAPAPQQNGSVPYRQQYK